MKIQDFMQMMESETFPYNMGEAKSSELKALILETTDSYQRTLNEEALALYEMDNPVLFFAA